MAIPLFNGGCCSLSEPSSWQQKRIYAIRVDNFLTTYLMRMVPLTLKQIEEAIRSSFALDTCSPDDVNEWSEQNRSRGHCAVTTLVLHDFFGGELVCAEVKAHGETFGYHWWNRLGAMDLDLTRDQFFAHEIVGEPWTTERPVGSDHFYAAQYLLFRSRVVQALTVTSTESSTVPSTV